MRKRVSDYLKSERQWPRYCRVRKARMAFRNATKDTERKFWTEVLEALGATNRMIPSTADLLERSLVNESRASAKITMAEVQ